MILSPWRLIWCDLCGQSAKIRLPLSRINLNRNERLQYDSTVVLDRFATSASARRPPNVSNVAPVPGVMPMTPRANMPHGVLRTIPTSRKTTDPSTSARAVRPAVPDMAKAGLRGLTGAVRTGPVRIVRAATVASVPRRRIVRVPRKNPSVSKYAYARLRAQIRRLSGPSVPTTGRRGISVTANVRGRRNVTVRSAGRFGATIAAAEVRPQQLSRYNPPTCKRAKSA